MGIFARLSTAADERSARLAGIGLMLAAICMFSFGDALGKFIVATYSVGQLMLLRACASLLLLAPSIWGGAAPNFGGSSGPGCSCCASSSRRWKSRRSFSPPAICRWPMSSLIIWRRRFSSPRYRRWFCASRSAGGGGVLS
jgi:hypothetical protein